MAQFTAPSLSVTGATLPGLPFVVLGHNDRTAWGFTNTHPDTQDLFIERLDPSDPNFYQTPDGPRLFSIRKERIKIKGLEDEVITVRESRHGPVISDLVGQEIVQGREVLAFAWTALRDDDLTVQAGIKFNRIRNWDDFVAAARDFHGPQQNIVYADVDGNIGFFAPGRVPIRRSGNGRLPVPGWTGAFDWEGFIPFSALPRAYNPPSGVVVTANNKIVPDNYPYLLTLDWAPPFRARRIEQLLAASETHDVASFRDIQADTTSLIGLDFLPHLISASPGTEMGRAAQRRLAGWHGDMARDAPEPLIYSAWHRAVSGLVYADALGSNLPNYWHFPTLFLDWILNRGGGHWCNDVVRSQDFVRSHRETCTNTNRPRV